MKKLIFIPFIVFGLLCVQAQELTKEDYARAVSFMYDNYNNKTAFNLYTSINWFKERTLRSSKVLFLLVKEMITLSFGIISK